jgi:prepilin peptidase CpaA
MIVALAYHGMNGGFSAILLSLAGLFIGTAIFFIPYLLGFMGAGDAKLMGVVGAMLGPTGLLTVGLLAFLSGGIYALVIILANRRYGLDFISRLYITFTSLVRFRKYVPFGPEPGKGISIPYAVPISLGTGIYLTLTRLGYQPITWITG